MSIKDRILNLMEQKGLTKADLFRLVPELKRSTFYNIFDSKTNPKNITLDTIRPIAKALDTTLDYIINGIEASPNIDVFNYSNIKPIEKKKIPLLGEIACGEPIYANEDRESYIEIGANIRADFCLRAQGDSMIGARILDGDIVFIRQQPMVENGEIAAVLIGDNVTLKRVYFEPNMQKMVLNSENPKYQPFVFVGEELSQVKILGKAVAFESDIK